MWCYLLHFRKAQSSWVTYSRSESEFKPNILMIPIIKSLPTISLVQFSCSVMSDSVIPWTAAYQASLSITNSQSLLKVMSIKSVMPSHHLILCHPFSCPQSFPALGSFPMNWLFAYLKESNWLLHTGLVSCELLISRVCFLWVST